MLSKYLLRQSTRAHTYIFPTHIDTHCTLYSPDYCLNWSYSFRCPFPACGYRSSLLWETFPTAPATRAAAAAAAESLQSYPTLRLHRQQPTRLLLHGIFQAGVLEWGAIAFSASLCTYANFPNPTEPFTFDHICLPHCFSPTMSPYNFNLSLLYSPFYNFFLLYYFIIGSCHCVKSNVRAEDFLHSAENSCLIGGIKKGHSTLDIKLTSVLCQQPRDHEKIWPQAWEWVKIHSEEEHMTQRAVVPWAEGPSTARRADHSIATSTWAIRSLLGSPLHSWSFSFLRSLPWRHLDLHIQTQSTEPVLSACSAILLLDYSRYSLHHIWDLSKWHLGWQTSNYKKHAAAAAAAKLLQLCPTPSDPMDCSLPGSSAHGIFQARVLGWGAIAFSKTKHAGGRLN